MAKTCFGRVAPLLLLVAAQACVFPMAQRAHPGEGHNRAGLAHFRAGRYAEAESEFNQALKMEPESAAARQNLGLMRLEQDRVEEARALLAEALDRTSDSEKNLKSTILVNLGYSFLLERRLDEARDQYRAALSVNPVKSDPYFRLVEIAFETGTLDQTIGEFENAEKTTDPDDADGVDKVFLPEQAIIYALGLQGRYADVVARTTKDLEALQGVKTEFASRLTVIPTPFFVYWKKTAARHINTEPIKESILSHRAHAYLNQGLLDEAIADFKQIGDASLRRYYGLGLVALEQGDGKEAAYDLRRYTEARPKDAAGLLYYSAALRLGGEASGAEAVLQRMQERPPPRSPPLKSGLELVKAQAFVDQVWKRYDRALAGYEWVLMANPAYGQVYRKMGEILLERGDKAKAREVLLKAVDLCPRDVLIPRLLEKADVHAALTP